MEHINWTDVFPSYLAPLFTLEFSFPLASYVFTVIFLFVIGLFYVAHRFFLPTRFKLRRLPWEMLGWPLHILSDIPTHTYKFFPTPFLYPFFSTKINGYAWAHPLFLAIDYGLLILVYAYLWRKSLFKRN